ncbi:MAG: C39 family peptidase [Candidatus Bathyarchaeota archaeon]|nr:MAG: C39 family peptidase [Candidatus Bathyarchaeota archaeon]
MTHRKIISSLIIAFSSLLILKMMPYPASGIPLSNFIPVTYHAQETSYYCGPATVQMALGYLLDTCPTQDELATEVETDAKAGVTHTEKMRKAFDNRGFTRVYERELNFNELKIISSKGYLIIILIYFDNTHEYQHYVLVIGYHTDTIYIHDPWPISSRQPEGRTSGANASLSKDLLGDLWSCQPSNWGLAIPYSEKSITRTPNWNEHWPLLVALPTAAVTAVLVIMLVRKKKQPSPKSTLEDDNPTTRR